MCRWGLIRRPVPSRLLFYVFRVHDVPLYILRVSAVTFTLISSRLVSRSHFLLCISNHISSQALTNIFLKFKFWPLVHSDAYFVMDGFSCGTVALMVLDLGQFFWYLRTILVGEYFLPRGNSCQLSHLARALTNFRLIFSPSLKDAVPILRINFYRISLWNIVKIG